MSTFLSEKTKKTTSSIFHPTHKEVFGKQLDASCIEPLLTFDPNEIGKKCNISKLHFIAIDPSVERIEFKVNKDGTYTTIGDSKNIYENMEQFEEGEEQFSELDRGYMNFKACEDYALTSEKNEIVLQAGEKPNWLQTRWEGTDWGDAVFIARLECYHLFGTIYLFYNPKKKLVIQVIECT